MRRKVIAIVGVLSCFSAVQADSNTTTCRLVASQQFGNVGDVSGKKIYTKEEFVYECKETRKIKAGCARYDSDTKYDINLTKGSSIVDTYYKTEDFSGSIGQTFVLMQGYDKINGIWSGWHGLCITGADDGNWDWLSDPYVLASYALTVGSAIANSVSSAAEAAADADNNAAGAVNATVDDVDIVWAASENADKIAEGAEAVKQAATYAKYAMCATQMGIDIGRMVEEYLSDGEPCDPVDELCGEEEDSSSSQIFTMEEGKFNDFMAGNTGDPDLNKYIEVVSTDNGVVTLRVKNPGVESKDIDLEDARKAMQKAKDIKLSIEATITTINTASCVASVSGGGGAAGSSSSNGEDVTSPANLARQIGKAALSYMCPVAGLALDVAMNTYESLQKINTCDSLDDAKEKGSRHEATWHAKRGGMCHLVEVRTKGKAALGTKQNRYRYCCYDSKLTRILVEQAKAQLGKSWAHCTGLDIQDIQNLNFRPCDPDELDRSVDGTKLPASAPESKRITAYQYTHQCIDTREMVEWMMETFGGDNPMIERSDINEMLDEYKIEKNGILH